MLTSEDARARVAKGAAHLDTVRPGWFNRIDVGTLTMWDPCGCIVGQLCMSRPDSDWWTGERFFSAKQMCELSLLRVRHMDLVEDDEYDARVSALGFDLIDSEVESDDDCDEYQILQDAWIEAIADRRLSQPVITEPMSEPVGA